MKMRFLVVIWFVVELVQIAVIGLLVVGYRLFASYTRGATPLSLKPQSPPR